MKHYPKTLRLLPVLVAAVLLTAGCGAMRQQSNGEKDKIAAQVQQRLDSRQYKIVIDYMMTRRGGSKAVTSPYSITVDGSRINSHLPYAGVAYSVPYGGGKVLTFEDDIDEYSDNPGRSGSRNIVFSTNNDEDVIVYTITVWDNGRADIHVNCRNRDDISYSGRLEPGQ